jgi:hypothetical protein
MSSKKTYTTYINKWKRYCADNNINYLQPTEIEAAHFLAFLFDNGMGYQSIKCAKGALSTIASFGDSKLMKSIMKGIFLKRPSIPMRVTWDANMVIDYYKGIGPIKMLTLRQLTIKLTILLSLTMAQRQQSLHLIDTRYLEWHKTYIKIRYLDLLKSSRPGFHQEEIILRAYTQDKCVCPLYHLKEYIKRVDALRPHNVHNLLLTTQKPHKAAKIGTIGGWIREGLENAGINMIFFTPHSTRAAATSAMSRSVPLITLLRTAGWSSGRTFTKYYNKEVLKKGVGVTDLTGPSMT